MKMTFYFLAIISIAFTSCNSKQNSKLLSPHNLPSYLTILNSDSAYNLKTPNGAQIKIAANSFQVSPNTRIMIEIKEAYSMQDILLGGLPTESDGKPLKSAGMFYFSASLDNKEVKFLKPIQVTLPSKTYDSSMQVFSSEIKADSTINWINPQAVDTSPAMKNLIAGKSLFNSNCANCHKSFDNLTGPALAGARQRAPDQEWPYRFINNTNVMLQTDNYARRLASKFGSRMTQFNLSKYEIKAILDYCDNEAAISNRNSDTSEFPKIDQPCGYDTFYYSKPKENIEIIPFKETSIDTSSTIETNLTATTNRNQTNEVDTENEFAKKGYKYVMPPNGMYQFNIDKSGWFNIDVLFDDPTASKVELFSKVQMDGKYDVNLYLCIPKRKILMEADQHNNDIYIFHYSDPNGRLPLVLNDEAFILGTASAKDKIYYGITKFKVTTKQTITLNIKESTKDEILSGIKSNQLDSIKLDIEKKEMEIIQKPCLEAVAPSLGVVTNTRPGAK